MLFRNIGLSPSLFQTFPSAETQGMTSVGVPCQRPRSLGENLRESSSSEGLALSPSFRVIAFRRSVGGTPGRVSRKILAAGSVSWSCRYSPADVPTRLLSRLPSTSMIPRLGLVQVIPSRLSA